MGLERSKIGYNIVRVLLALISVEVFYISLKIIIYFGTELNGMSYVVLSTFLIAHIFGVIEFYVRKRTKHVYTLKLPFLILLFCLNHYELVKILTYINDKKF